MTDGIRTHLVLDGDDLLVNRVQDAEPLLEWAKERAKQPNPKGEKFWEKWTLTNVQIEDLYNKYSKGTIPAPPMDQEFWQWVDKTVMSDADYTHCRLINKSNPFHIGYTK